MKVDSFFTPDADTKQLIKEMSSLFGIKSDIITDFLNYLTFVWLLQLAQNPDKVQTLTLPYIGKLGVKFNKDFINQETGKMETEVDVFVALNDSFKRMISDIKDRDISELTTFLRTNYIERLIENSSQT